ncbi:MAG: DEAD/DEAH box helicase [Thermoplasmata archaeon]
MNVYDRFKEVLLKYYPGFVPTPIQKKSMPVITKGNNVLIIAPTGTGKTEAALFPVLLKILKNSENAIACLYITPLKSLNRDIYRRIVNFSNDIGIPAFVRHGDTSSFERSKLLKNPPKLLITTPESVQTLFLSKNLMKYVKNIRYIVIDEVHELFYSIRGAQLSIAIERLKAYMEVNPQIISLSATVGNVNELKSMISGKVEVIHDDTPKQNILSIKGPDKDINPFDQYPPGVIRKESIDIHKKVIEEIKKHQKTIVFVNTRQYSEYLTKELKKLDNLDIGIHHSSLSKEVRLETEKDFREESMKAIVSTSSLELGIDIGLIDFIIQMNSPRQVVRLTQRIGRSGHKLGYASQGAVYSDNWMELLEAGVIVNRMLKGVLEKFEVRKNSPVVIANQIIAMGIEYAKQGIAADYKNIYETIKRSYPFSTLTKERFNCILQYLETIHLIRNENGKIHIRLKGYKYFYENISMIPDVRTYRVRDMATNSIIGTVDEKYVTSILSMDNQVILIKGLSWIVEDISEEEIMVRQSSSEALPPQWTGEDIPVSYEVSQEVGYAIRTKSLYDYPFDSNAIGYISRVMSLFEGHARPSEKEILFEVVYLDGTYNHILHCFFGTKVNNTLAMILSYRINTMKNITVQYNSTQFKIYIQSTEKMSIDDFYNFFSYKTDGIENEVKNILSDTANLKWDLINAAKKFGALTVKANIFQVNLDEILKNFFHTPIGDEAIESVMHSKMEVNLTEEIIKKIFNKEIKLVKSDIQITPNEEISTNNQEIYSNALSQEIINVIETRLKKAKLYSICLKCGTAMPLSIESTNLPLKCPVCNGSHIAVSKEDAYSVLVKKSVKGQMLTREETKKVDMLYSSANLVKTYGKNFLYCLAGYGIGINTASEILFKSGNDKNKMIGLIIKKENEYRKNRIYWA